MQSTINCCSLWQHDDDAPGHQREDDDDDDDEEEEQKMQPHLAPQYKHLITIRAGKPKGSLADALKSDPEKVRRLSLSEQQLAKVAEDHATEIVRYTYTYGYSYQHIPPFIF